MYQGNVALLAWSLAVSFVPSTLSMSLVQQQSRRTHVKVHNADPSGYTLSSGKGVPCENPIASREACVTAAKAMGWKWDGTRSWNDRLHGCLKTNLDQDVVWNPLPNPAPGVALNDDQTPLCVAPAATSSPTAKPTNSPTPQPQMWDFTMPANGNLVGVLMGPTSGSGKTEVHILSESSNYQDYALQVGTLLDYTSNGNWAFTMKGDGDLVGILKGPVTGSGKTEVHILSAASNYNSWALQVGTGLGYTTNADWAFTMKANGDLVCILKGPVSGTGKTEVHILSAASNYQEFVLHTGTALGYTNNQDWDFTMKNNDDLVGILKGPVSGTGKTEVHILSAASNYQEFVLETGTGLDYTTGNGWAFTMRHNDDLVGILKGPTSGTGMTEVHMLSAASNYQNFDLQVGTGLGYTFS